MLICDEVSPFLPRVAVFSYQATHECLSCLTLGLHSGIVAATFILAFDDPVHTIGVLGDEVWEVAVLGVEVNEGIVLWV